MNTTVKNNCVFVEMMIYHYYNPLPYFETHTQSGASRDAINKAVDANLLTAPEQCESWLPIPYEITDRGKVYVESLLDVGFPRQTWVPQYPDTPEFKSIKQELIRYT